MKVSKLLLVLALAAMLIFAAASAEGYTSRIIADVDIPVAVDGSVVYVDGEYEAEEAVSFAAEWFEAEAEEGAEPYAVLNMLLMPDGSLQIAEDEVFDSKLMEVLKSLKPETEEKHLWGDAKELTEANCRQQGLQMITCKDCGAIKFNVVYGVHSYGEAKVTQQSTCAKYGIRERICSVCGYAAKEKLAKTNNHKPVVDKAAEPTYDKNGLTEGKHCSVCGKTLVAQKVIPAIGYSVFMTVNGESYSSVMHEQYTALEVCVPDGLPIETKDGYTFVGYRTDAGTLYKVGELIPLNEFIEKDGAFYINLTAAFEKDETEDPDVVYTDIDSYTVRLSIVSPLYYDSTITTETYSYDPEKDISVGTVSYPSSRQLATYVRKGLTPVGFRSLTTGNVFTIGDAYDLNKLPAAAYVDQTVNDVSETEKQRVSNYAISDSLVPLYSFCGATGAFLDPLYTCEIAFYVPSPIDDSKNPNAAVTTVNTQTVTGISMEELTASDYYVSLKNAPEYEGYIFNGYGLLTGSSVTISGKELALNDVIPNLVIRQNGQLSLNLKLHYSIDKRCPKCGANDSEATTEGKTPTCTTAGLTEGKHCSVCNTVLVAQEEIAPLGHTEVVDISVAPTCTTAGLSEGKHCSVCKEVLVAQTEIPTTGHKFAYYGKCDVCGYWCTHPNGLANAGYYSDADHYGYCDVHNGIGYQEHTFDNCVCTVCGYAKHTPETVDVKSPTCTEDGYEAGTRCTVCQTVLSGMKPIPALGHDEYLADVDKDTHFYRCKRCDVLNPEVNYGWRAFHKFDGCACTVCGYEKHTEVIDPGFAATCTTAGLTDGKHCSVCNKVLVAQTEIPTANHLIDNCVCRICGFEKHTPEEVEAKDPICSVRGYTAGTRCSVCQKVLNGIEPIPALDHDFECAPYSEMAHFYECKRCHFQKSEPHRTVEGYCGCVVCGYQVHIYACEPVNSSEHRTYCTRCGYEADRFFHSGSRPCEYCGYDDAE